MLGVGQERVKALACSQRKARGVLKNVKVLPSPANYYYYCITLEPSAG